MSWDELSAEYNLEGKVFFDESGNVRRKEEQTKADDPDRSQKRKITVPKYLDDFVLPN